MLLHAERDRSWSVEDVCEALACPPTWAAAQLETMTTGGLLVRAGGTWRFSPASRELENATAELEDAYRRHPRDIVRFVFAPVRSSVE
jgi:hypothetical protein